MDNTVICALISGGVTLIVSIGTWHLSARKDRENAKIEFTKALDNHYARTMEDIKGFHSTLDNLKDDITQVNATIQNQVAVLDVKIDTLSTRVEKHNNVIERVFKLEQAVEDLKN